jgi:hypothetical protein
MNNLRWGAVARLAAVACLLPLLVGCFKYKETITILPGGNGDVVITASIPEASAAMYCDKSKVQGQVPPPISQGLIDQLMLGSPDVRVADSSVELKGDNWEYNVKVEFGSIEALSQVRYFKERHIKKEFAGGKKMKVSEDITPNLVQMARNQAKLMVDNPYAGPFMAVVDSDDFHNVTDSATMTYELVLPGAEPETSSGAKTEPRPDDVTSAAWSFTMSDLQGKKTPPNLYLTVSLPGEHGALSIVIALLLASVIGILAPAIRLIMIKTKGGA